MAKLVESDYNKIWDEPEDEFFDKHWREMPEFIQEDLMSKYKIVVHFRNEEDFIEFAELIGQEIRPTTSTKSTWYPPEPVANMYNKRYTEYED